jgi:anti-sigma B factor antagonist
VARRDATPFRVTTCLEGTSAVITVRGELDIASAAAMREALLALIADEVPDLAVDGSGVTFIDSSGLAVLLMASRRWGQAGKRIVLRSPSRTLARIVDLTGVRRAFEIE